MGIWHISADTLARSRFTVSALAEAIAGLHALDGRGAIPGLQAWVAAHAPAFRDRLAADPLVALFVKAAVKPRWQPDFMVLPPRPADRTFHDEVRQVRQAPVDSVLADLAVAMDGQVPPELRVPDLPARVADLLEWVWTHTIRPDWPRRRRVFEADIVSRTQQLSSRGWEAALGRLRPGMRWLGDGRLQINAYGYPPRDLADAQLLFVPSTARRGWVAWDPPHRYAVVYPCSGLLAEPHRDVSVEALNRLLGVARASVLLQLRTPKSTTQLVAATGYGLGSVGSHLKVLLDAQLVRRSRAGRSVLYYRTPTGDQLVGGGRPR
jgi:DNA-binding transcriptional ArsR family regulator